MKTVQEIQTEHGDNSGRIMNSYLDAIHEIRDTRQPEAGAYLDRLSGEQRMALLREQALEKAGEAHTRTLRAYTEEVERYLSEIAQRRTHLKGQLFRVKSTEALASAATASDAGLGAMMEMAAQTGNTELGRAAFVGAHQRGLGELVAAHFDQIEPASRALYEEWSELPDESALQRERDNVEAVVQMPGLDRLMPWASAMGVR